MTDFQLMLDIEKKMFIQRIVDICNADNKSFRVIEHNVKKEEERLESLHIQLPKSLLRL
jgi:hypothetical protein